MKKPSKPKQPFEVGYGKPPAHTRFQPGKSGNPKGRSKGSPNLTTAFNRALNEKVVVIENGRRKSITKLDLAMKGLVNRAAKGDPRATQQLLTLAPHIGIEPVPHSNGLDATEAAVLAEVMKHFGVAKDVSSDPIASPPPASEGNSA